MQTILKRRTSYNCNILSIVLAGGVGSRLFPLTADRAKPAVPIGGRYRLIDIVLSNFVNSGLYKIKVITQYKSDSLNKHISRGWHFPYIIGQYVEAVPAQQRVDKSWFKGSADAIYQSLNVFADENPDLLVIFGGDHIYTMDVRQMIDFHLLVGADLTIAAIPMPASEASQFGVIEVDANWRVVGFQEKPQHPKEMPTRPGWSLVSMGNYVFTCDALVEAVTRDHDTDGSKHDMGGDIVPDFVSRGDAFVYDFKDNDVPGATERDKGYWRDVGTLDSYFDAHMDLISVHPVFNLYNYDWQIYTSMAPLPPAKFVHGSGDRVGEALSSMVSPGVVVSGAQVNHSILSPNVRVHSYATIADSVLLDGVEVGRYSVIRRAIIDKNVVIPEYCRIGVDHEHDRARGFYVTEGGVTVVGKGQPVPL